MITTNNKYRSFYPQLEINWLSTFTPIEIQNECNFYFSGDNGLELIYKLKNNKIYSKSNDLLGTYNNNSEINFSGNVSTNSIDLYKDGLPLYLGKNRDYTGYLSNFIYEIDSGTLDIASVSILGKDPEYFIDTNLVYNSGLSIPIQITNSGDYDITIYSGEVNDDNFELSGANNLVIGSNSTNLIYLINSNNFQAIDQILNVDLYTNFGLENIFINVSGQEILFDNLFYINLSPPVNNIFSSYNLLYSLSFANESGSDIEISLEYVSGITGEYYSDINRTAYHTGIPISGFISGQGTIVNEFTGLLTEYNNLKNLYEYGTGTGFASGFKIADDIEVTGTYNIISTGVGKVDFTTDITGTGFVSNVEYSGFIGIQGGILTGTVTNFPITGKLYQTTYTDIENIGYSTIFQNWTGDVNLYFDSSEYETVSLLSPILSVTGNFLKHYPEFAIYAWATGGRYSGKLQGDFGSNDYEPGLYNFSKPFTGPVTGEVIEYTGFDPVKNSIETTMVTGLISTTIYQYIEAIGCKIDLEFDLTGTGIPDTVYRLDDTGYVFPLDIYLTRPIYTGEEYPYENSNFVTYSGNVSLHPLHPTGGRTRVSDGYFDNVFQEPFFTGVSSLWSGNQKIYSGYGEDFIGWRQSLQLLSEENVVITGVPPQIISISGDFDLYNPTDTQRINFSLTGIHSGVNLSSQTEFLLFSYQTGQVITANIYKSWDISGRTYAWETTGSSGEYLLQYINPYYHPNQISGNVNTISGHVLGDFLINNIIQNSPLDFQALIINTGTYLQNILIDTASGCFYYYDEFNNRRGNPFLKYYVGNNISLNPGDYYVDISSSSIEQEEVPLHVQLAPSTTGCERDGIAYIKLAKTGFFQDYKISGSLLGKFRGPSYPNVPIETLTNGISWDFNMSAEESVCYFALPIYQNNRMQVPVEIDLTLNVEGFFNENEYTKITSTTFDTNGELIIYDEDNLSGCMSNDYYIDGRIFFLNDYGRTGLLRDFAETPQPKFGNDAIYSYIAQVARSVGDNGAGPDGGADGGADGDADGDPKGGILWGPAQTARGSTIEPTGPDNKSSKKSACCFDGIEIEHDNSSDIVGCKWDGDVQSFTFLLNRSKLIFKKSNDSTGPCLGNDYFASAKYKVIVNGQTICQGQLQVNNGIIEGADNLCTFCTQNYPVSAVCVIDASANVPKSVPDRRCSRFTPKRLVYASKSIKINLPDPEDPDGECDCCGHFSLHPASVKCPEGLTPMTPEDKQSPFSCAKCSVYCVECVYDNEQAGMSLTQLLYSV